ncbi:MAG TPA: hypothetical protein PKA10_16645 [Selenomonadales bacterium]|nr:hypothetical protein [Selenomonadales bacterium]
MLLLLLGYFFSFIMYSIAIFLALLFMEISGKKHPGSWQSRSYLAALWAAGAVMAQLLAHATSVVYLGVFR